MLEHVREKKGFSEFSKQGLLGSDKLENLNFCEYCINGKSHKVKFSTRAHTTKK